MSPYALTFISPFISFQCTVMTTAVGESTRMNRTTVMAVTTARADQTVRAPPARWWLALDLEVAGEIGVSEEIKTLRLYRVMLPIIVPTHHSSNLKANLISLFCHSSEKCRKLGMEFCNVSVNDNTNMCLSTIMWVISIVQNGRARLFIKIMGGNKI